MKFGSVNVDVIWDMSTLIGFAQLPVKPDVGLAAPLAC